MPKEQCETRDELLASARTILERIHEVSAQQIDIMDADGISHHFILRDKQLELLMGEKERAVGALRQHDEEHGCQKD